VTHPVPPFPSAISSALTHIGEIVASSAGSKSGIVPTALCEYFPLKKINSVPNDATAFRRGAEPSVLILLRWPGEGSDELVDGKKKVDLARQYGNELADIITGGKAELSLGYTNYGP
jgi:hypothetical protein